MRENLALYQNGNVAVSLFPDGTLTREWEGEARPVHPCSVDLKITDHCNANCRWCHERSTKAGVHASLGAILRTVEALPQGVEIAIGGGNPLDHPQIEEILQAFAERGLVSNLTVHHSHYASEWQRLGAFQATGLLHGIGASIDSAETGASLPLLPNLVFHVIAGVTPPRPLLRWKPERLLVLGYKRYGRGERFYSKEVETRLTEWRFWLMPLLLRCPLVSFDNLAIEQLGVRALVSADAWSSSYMGDDGAFTMYVDAVRNEYAVSSTSTRFEMGEMTARDAFLALKER